MIVDQFGNPIDTGRLREPQTASVAHLQRQFEDHPARGLTPPRLHQILTYAEQGDISYQLDLAEDMEERDGHLFAELDKRAGAVAQLAWSIEEPKNATPAEKKVADQLREWVDGFDVDSLLRSMMSAVLRSFSCIEMVWVLQDGVLLPTFAERPHRWFRVDAETRNQLLLRSLEVKGGEQGTPLQPWSWIAHIHKTRTGYLARGGLTRVLAWPYLFKNYAVRDLAEMLEIFGIPLRLGKYPSGASDTEKLALLQAVTQIGHNAAGIIPTGMLIEFQAAANGTDAPFKSMTDMMDAVESKVILGQTLTASEGKSGTQALGKVHNDVRLDIRDSDARQLERTLTPQLLYPLAVLNIPGADPRRLPRFSLQTTEPEDLQVFADTLPKLTGVGMRIPVKWAHDKLRIPEPIENEAVLEAPAAAAPPAAAEDDPAAAGTRNVVPIKPKPKAAALKGQPAPADAHDVFAALAAEAAGDWQPQLGPMVSPLFAELDRAIAAGEDIASFRARLPELVTQMDHTPMGERLARVSFVGALNGAAGLDP